MSNSTGQSRLYGEGLTVGYDATTICENLDVSIPDGSFTVIIGPNACGKSTLLRALSRLLPAQTGAVYLDGEAIDTYKNKEVARRLGLLPQTSMAPDGICVVDLVARGRFCHQTFLRQWTPADGQAVEEAMAATGVSDLAPRRFDALSGGQRQRVWLAMVLAQQTDLLLLDEPTTFLDIAHQIEILDLCRRLQRRSGRTLVAVLHDLNQAGRYATNLIVMKEGDIIAQGDPATVLTAELVEAVFELPCMIIEDPVSKTPLIVPLDRDSEGGLGSDDPEAD